jgi:DNA-binding MarR family transcriptional regulator
MKKSASATRNDDPLLLDRQVCFPLYAASNLLTRVYRPVLAPLGLTYSQYLVMLVLWERSPVSVGDLGERLHIDSGTLTPLLKRMEHGGFINRSRDPDDERRVLVALTAHGRDLRSAARKVPETLSRRLNLSPAAVEELRNSVQALVRVLAGQTNSGAAAENDHSSESAERPDQAVSACHHRLHHNHKPLVSEAITPTPHTPIERDGRTVLAGVHSAN